MIIKTLKGWSGSSFSISVYSFFLISDEQFFLFHLLSVPNFSATTSEAHEMYLFRIVYVVFIVGAISGSKDTFKIMNQGARGSFNWVIAKIAEWKNLTHDTNIKRLCARSLRIDLIYFSKFLKPYLAVKITSAAL